MKLGSLICIFIGKSGGHFKQLHVCYKSKNNQVINNNKLVVKLELTSFKVARAQKIGLKRVFAKKCDEIWPSLKTFIDCIFKKMKNASYMR